jgi:hypothetical protein
MPTNLKEHAVFIERLQMEMVPLSVALKAISEAYSECDDKLEDALNMIENSVMQINKTISEND